jgi:FixJ family two-component response regulator
MHRDARVLEAIERLACSAGWETRLCSTPTQLMAASFFAAPSCLVLDLVPGEDDALELLRRIARERPETPVILVAGVCDVPTAVRAIKAGAFDVVVTPCADGVLARALAAAFESSRTLLDRRERQHDLHERYGSLSPRERAVMALVVAGRLNKQVGAELGICEITVKAHRGKVMRKMGADSLPDLVTMATRLQLAIPSTGRSAPTPRHGASTSILPQRGATASLAA